MADPAPPSPRVEALLARLTLEEKVGQLHQAHGLGAADHADLRAGRLGSAIVATSATAGNDRQERVRAAELNALQRIAVQESRLGIPLLFARDVIHGHRTVAPIPLAQAASFSPAHVEACAAVAAREARADGITWVYTPMLDIARDPRWGRVAESFGEDPHLGARLAAAAVRGYQGTALNDPERVAACAKHFVGYGAVEGGRDYNTLEITAHTLHNVHLPPFRAAVDAGVASVMSAFCDVGGVPVAAHPGLLTDVLRGTLGFPGVLVTDWGAVLELLEHGVAATEADAARLALLAGNDIDMASGAYRACLPALVASGAVPLDRVDAAVRRVLALKDALGLFDDPYADEGAAPRVHGRADHRAVTTDLARRSVVLLQNRDDVLPLRPGLRIGVVGAAAGWRGQLFGTWTLDGDAAEVPTLLEAVRALAGPGEVWHTVNLDEAMDWARSTDVLIVALGETPTRSGEDHSVAGVELPAGQLEQLEALRELDVPIVTVVFAGRPLVLTRAARASAALLLAWHPGVSGGTPVAEILFGAVNPSGHLPVTLPRHGGQSPAHYNHKPTGRPVATRPGAFRLSDQPDAPLYPFGFGLSYTPFTFTDLRVSAAHVRAGEDVQVRVTVSNTGERAGEVVTQLYLRDVHSSRTRPVRELRGFERVALPAGASADVTFTLGPQELGFYDDSGRLTLEPGAFQIWVGADSRASLTATFEVRPLP
ncbi:beta-glucosidase [Deinococcus metalli]|uniref:beta-glucosidase n=1 Tax=Deinococcus metalli TaxID=1141878 RepID=A0A7W8KEH1_9DEIO|nr:glycoside hydrolase family 3 N-terminal domain-containing protein [Deinococcus metalli]MBB5376692.1 beta-glucosidase [Deinococcus metalli]GHF65848.1 beta-glucosidase [Deinococcus metalli]